MLASATSLAPTARPHGAVIPPREHQRAGAVVAAASAAARAGGGRCGVVAGRSSPLSSLPRRIVTSRSSSVARLRAVGDSEPEKIIDSLKLVRLFVFLLRERERERER